MIAYENHLSIVLRSAEYRDNDRMLTLLTAKKGRISALARGVRKQGSPLFGATDVFCCAEYGFYIKNGRYIITQGNLKNNFYNIRSDLLVLMAASALCEIAELASTEEEDNPRLFALLASGLFALNNSEDVSSVFSFFSIKLLDVLGLRPMLNRCVICGKPRANKINIFHGGAVCSECPGETVPESYFAELEKALRTPSRDIMSSDVSSDKGLLQLLMRWVSESLVKTPKTLKQFWESVKTSE